MKYGERLNSYSVPEWRTNNILYDELKHEIKVLTSSPASFSRSGYERLVESFQEELRSVNLFVRCKLGEITYRFQQCRSQLKSGAAADDNWQVNKDVHKLNQEIYNLSRYIGAQFTGFRKLLKKYRRHAPQDQLMEGRDLRVIDKQLQDKDSFASVDLTRQFLELSDLYLHIRQLRQSNSTPAINSAKRLIEFDVEMLTSFGDVYRFWVHNDNLVQLKVQLLQYMDLVGSAELSGRTVIDYFDNLEQQSTSITREPAQLRTTKLMGNSSISSRLLVPSSGMRYTAANLPADQLSLLKADPTQILQSSEAGTDPALQWLVAHDCAKAASVRTECTRFKSSEGVWACLYSNVFVDGANSRFPHSVLEIRVQADQLVWLDTLRESYLLHPVPMDFSIYVWSVLVTRPQQVQERPEWLVDLENDTDIRRVPPNATKRARRSHHRQPQQQQQQEQQQQEQAEQQASQPEFRYWNEFDNGFDEEGGGEFLDEIDEELRRARTAAKLAQPVYQLGASMRRKFHNWFERGSDQLASSPSSNDMLFANETASFTSGDSRGTSFESPDEMSPLRRATGGRFSPRVGSSRRAVHYGSFPEQFNADLEAGLTAAEQAQMPFLGNNHANAFTRRNSDAALALITFLCFCLALAIVVLVFTILLTEDLTLLALGLRIALVLFMLMALSLSMLGYAANNFRSNPGWLSQAAIHIALLCVVCLGVGGIANIAVPQL